ncbi:hypothetical protein NDU88_001117 [Pleurodeles waltl]|uniref:Uncharacterized protein n=1 Tax=Pleurodeles waltl TaxID=8319 RepID=A0AAV7UT54_PLEWA|nr:hypothetical protein NDU88_001117 [Pleurodeles waltl]
MLVFSNSTLVREHVCIFLTSFTMDEQVAQVLQLLREARSLDLLVAGVDSGAWTAHRAASQSPKRRVRQVKIGIWGWGKNGGIGTAPQGRSVSAAAHLLNSAGRPCFKGVFVWAGGGAGRIARQREECRSNRSKREEGEGLRGAGNDWPLRTGSPESLQGGYGAVERGEGGGSGPQKGELGGEPQRT